MVVGGNVSCLRIKDNVRHSRVVAGGDKDSDECASVAEEAESGPRVSSERWSAAEHSLLTTPTLSPSTPTYIGHEYHSMHLKDSQECF